MIPEAARWYKASGKLDHHNFLLYFMPEYMLHPRYLNGDEYIFGWDYSAAQLERLGYIGDAIEIYRSHRGKKLRVFPEGAFLLVLLIVLLNLWFSSQIHLKIFVVLVKVIPIISMVEMI
jgi:hypothetical protein